MGKGIVAVIFSCCLHAFGAIEKKTERSGISSLNNPHTLPVMMFTVIFQLDSKLCFDLDYHYNLIEVQLPKQLVNSGKKLFKNCFYCCCA